MTKPTRADNGQTVSLDQRVVVGRADSQTVPRMQRVTKGSSGERGQPVPQMQQVTKPTVPNGQAASSATPATSKAATPSPGRKSDPPV